MIDKIAIVTGAAAGIGKETALKFSQRGAKLLISDVDKNGLNELEEIISGRGGEVESVKADVSKEEDVKKMLQAAVETYGTVDFAVNNAGISGGSATTGDYDVEEWDRVMNVNLRGQFLCMKHELELMQKQGFGSIVNLSSILGKVAYAQAPAYVAAKHGLVGLTKTAALEYAEWGIRVNAVCPGFIDTPMLQKAGITSDEETLDSVIAMHPIGRLGKPDEVAQAIVWLCSDNASFVTGHTLMVDGGYTAK